MFLEDCGDARLGSLLEELLVRAGFRRNEDRAKQEIVAEQACLAREFLEFFRGRVGRRVRFECCMLQTAVEDADGVVKWRDLTCEDDDDFDALWSRGWRTCDFDKGDEALLVPSMKPEVWSGPEDLVVANQSAKGQPIHARVVTVSHVRQALVGGDMGEACVVCDSGDVVGRSSRFDSRVEYVTRSKTRALRVTAAPRGRPVKNSGQPGGVWCAKDALILDVPRMPGRVRDLHVVRECGVTNAFDVVVTTERQGERSDLQVYCAECPFAVVVRRGALEKDSAARGEV
jgi:hypothetical protein